MTTPVTKRATVAGMTPERQSVPAGVQSTGLPAAFPIILGGTEKPRRLHPSARMTQVRQTVADGDP